MRVLVGTGISKKVKSKVIVDTFITVREGILLEFPNPAKKMKVSLVNDKKGKTLVLLFE